MNLVQAHDLETAKGHCINVIENTPEIGKTARWMYGRHPTDEGPGSYIENGEMYLRMDGNTVAGMADGDSAADRIRRPEFWLLITNRDTIG